MVFTEYVPFLRHSLRSILGVADRREYLLLVVEQQYKSIPIVSYFGGILFRLVFSQHFVFVSKGMLVRPFDAYNPHLVSPFSIRQYHVYLCVLFSLSLSVYLSILALRSPESIDILVNCETRIDTSINTIFIFYALHVLFTFYFSIFDSSIFSSPT